MSKVEASNKLSELDKIGKFDSQQNHKIINAPDKKDAVKMNPLMYLGIAIIVSVISFVYSFIK